MGEKAYGRQGIGPQVGGGGAERVGEDGTHHRVGEFTEGCERRITSSGPDDELCGSAPHSLVGVGEPGQCRFGGCGPGEPVPDRALEEVHDLTTRERVFGLGELKGRNRDEAGTVATYRS